MITASRRWSEIVSFRVDRSRLIGPVNGSGFVVCLMVCRMVWEIAPAWRRPPQQITCYDVPIMRECHMCFFKHSCSAAQKNKIACEQALADKCCENVGVDALPPR